MSGNCRYFVVPEWQFDVVFSVDTTRVEIREADPDVLGSDYINANYIRVSLFSITQDHLTVGYEKIAVTHNIQLTVTVSSPLSLLSSVARPGPAHENHLVAVLQTESPSRANL